MACPFWGLTDNKAIASVKLPDESSVRFDSIVLDGFILVFYSTKVCIFELSDPVLPRLKGEISGRFNSPVLAHIHDSCLFIACSKGGTEVRNANWIRVYDITEIVHPDLLSEFSSVQDPSNQVEMAFRSVVNFHDSKAYIISGTDLLIVEMAEPTAPRLAVRIPGFSISGLWKGKVLEPYFYFINSDDTTDVKLLCRG